MEPLLVWVVERTDNFPRKHKFSVGDRWTETCLDVLTSLVEAQYTRDKRPLLGRASRGLVRARVLARVAGSLRGLSNSQVAHFESESIEIGRMIGGWLRAMSQRAPATSVGAAALPAPLRGEEGQPRTG